jgi:hypothetical protein
MTKSRMYLEHKSNQHNAGKGPKNATAKKHRRKLKTGFCVLWDFQSSTNLGIFAPIEKS